MSKTFNYSFLLLSFFCFTKESGKRSTSHGLLLSVLVKNQASNINCLGQTLHSWSWQGKYISNTTIPQQCQTYTCILKERLSSPTAQSPSSPQQLHFPHIVTNRREGADTDFSDLAKPTEILTAAALEVTKKSQALAMNTISIYPSEKAL